MLEMRLKILSLIAVFNIMRTLKFKPQPTVCVFRCRQSNFRRFPIICRQRLEKRADFRMETLHKHGSQIWIFFAVESGVFACEPSSLSTADSSLLESGKNICSKGSQALQGDQRSGLLAESQQGKAAIH